MEDIMKIILKSLVLVGALLMLPVFGVQLFVYQDGDAVMAQISSSKKPMTCDKIKACSDQESIYLTDLISEKMPLYKVGQEIKTRLVTYDKFDFKSGKLNDHKVQECSYIVEEDTKFVRPQHANDDILLRRVTLTVQGTQSVWGRRVKVVELWERQLPVSWFADRAYYVTEDEEYRVWRPLKLFTYATLLTGLAATIGGFIKFA